MSNPFSSGGALSQLATPMSEQVWEDKITSWECPASATESEAIERAARMVREALSDNDWLMKEGVVVASQGSYWNNTNVRLQADMDIRVVHPTAQVEYSDNYSALAKIGAYRVVPETAEQIASRLRNEINKSLNSAFGSDHVDACGGKAFTISAVSGSRSDIDVVPALTFDYNFSIGEIQGRHTGIVVFDKNTSKGILNFPEQHYRNGVQKRACTEYRFKKVVRSIKSIRDRFIELGILEVGAVPSFLIESLVYRVENVFFIQTESKRQRLLRVLSRVRTMLDDKIWVATANEINDIKLLFGPHQGWDVAKARLFVDQAVRFISI